MVTLCVMVGSGYAAFKKLQTNVSNLKETMERGQDHNAAAHERIETRQAEMNGQVNKNAAAIAAIVGTCGERRKTLDDLRRMLDKP